MFDCNVLKSVINATLFEPAEKSVIGKFEIETGIKLPLFLENLYQCSNGLTINETGLYLYAIEDIAERNATYEVRVYLPDMIMIGDDSGGRAIVAPLSSSNSSISIVSMGSFAVEDFSPLADSFENWLKQGFPISKN